MKSLAEHGDLDDDTGNLDLLGDLEGSDQGSDDDESDEDMSQFDEPSDEDDNGEDDQDKSESQKLECSVACVAPCFTHSFFGLQVTKKNLTRI